MSGGGERGAPRGGAIGRLLGAGNNAEVFEWDTGRVIKLYRSPEHKAAAFREAAAQAAVERLGLPVPTVWAVQRLDDRWGIVFERIREASFAEHMRSRPEMVALHLDEMARLHLRVHSHAVPQFASLKVKLASDIAAVTLIGEAQKSSLLDELRRLPDGDRLCHGDFHPLNVLGDPTHPVVIDWPDARRGEPAADVCRSYLLLRLHAEPWAEPYVAAYCRAGSMRREAIIAWLPYIAAARLAENVQGEAPRLLAMVE
jgi:hypothetical protein